MEHYFSLKVSDLLKYFHEGNKHKFISLAMCMLKLLNVEFVFGKHYQSCQFAPDKQILLQERTQEKYLLAKSILPQNGEPFTFGNVGAANGLLSMKIVQNTPNCTGIMYEILQSERDVMNRTLETLNLRKVLQVKEKADGEEKFDYGIYFAVIHHMMTTKPLKQCLQEIAAQVNKIAIIEFPFIGDMPLEHMISHLHNEKAREHYQALESFQRVAQEIDATGLFTINQVIDMKYCGTGHYKRKTIILVKK
jgi:hypothetical protein